MSTKVKEEEMEEAQEGKVQEEVIGRRQVEVAGQLQAHTTQQLHLITKDRVNLRLGKMRKVIQDTDRAKLGSPLLLSPDLTLGGHLVSEEIQKTLPC